MGRHVIKNKEELAEPEYWLDTNHTIAQRGANYPLIIATSSILNYAANTEAIV